MANKAVIPTSPLANPPIDGHVTTLQVDSHTKLLGDIIRAQQVVSEATLVAGIDPALGEDCLVTLTAGRVMGLPINGLAGQRLHVLVTQGGAGGYGLTPGAGITFKNVALNLGVGDKTDLTLTCLSPTSWVCTLPPASGSGAGLTGLRLTDTQLAKLTRGWPGLAGLATVMAAPPTITLSAAGAATQVAGSTLFDPPGYVWAGGPKVSIDGGTSSGALWTEEDSTISSFALTTDSPKFEILLKGHGQKYRVWINDQVVTAAGQGPIPADGATYRLLIDWAGGRAMRSFKLEAIGTRMGWAGFQTVTTDTMAPVARRGPRVIMVGDSFAESTGANPESGFPQLLAQLTGWEIWPLAEGGTGYLQPNVGAGRTKAMGHINDVLNNAPELVLWCLGINDTAFSQAAIQAEAAVCYAAVKAALPDVPQIVVGPFWGTGNGYQNSTWIAVRNGISAAAAAAGLPFADPVGSGYLRGTGKVGATAGNGNADFLVSNDGTHPSPAGHEALARAVAGTIAGVLKG